ncbi:unnamed protein product [Prunus brigantina]
MRRSRFAIPNSKISRKPHCFHGHPKLHVHIRLFYTLPVFKSGRIHTYSHWLITSSLQPMFISHQVITYALKETEISIKRLMCFIIHKSKYLHQRLTIFH